VDSTKLSRVTAIEGILTGLLSHSGNNLKQGIERRAGAQRGIGTLHIDEKKQQGERDTTVDGKGTKPTSTVS